MEWILIITDCLSNHVKSEPRELVEGFGFWTVALRGIPRHPQYRDLRVVCTDRWKVDALWPIEDLDVPRAEVDMHPLPGESLPHIGNVQII